MILLQNESVRVVITFLYIWIGVMKEVKIGRGRLRMRFSEDVGEWK